MEKIIPQPLERFPCPPGLSGEDGKFRAPAEQNYLRANTDYEAVKAWLDEYHEGNKPDQDQPTWLNYRKEAERLLLWCWTVAGKPLSSLDGLDLTEYMEFLEEPPDHWISTVVYRRTDPRWRPITPRRKRSRPGDKKLGRKPEQEKGLSNSSRLQTKRILKSMFAYLRINGYLVRNPLESSVKTRRGRDTGATSASDKTGVERYLSEAAFNFALKTNDRATKAAVKAAKTEIPRIEAEIEETRAKLKAAPANLKNKTRVALKKQLNQQLRELAAARNEVPRLTRQRWMILFLFYSGARRSELAKAVMGDLEKRDLMGEPGHELNRWWWKVVGKGAKSGDVPLPDVAIDALVAYRESINLPPLPSKTEKTPLVARLPKSNGQPRKGGNLAPSIIYREVKDFFQQAAAAARLSDDPEERGYESDLNLASTHWMRHTYATKMVNSNIPLTHAQKNLRHAKLETTARYLHTEQRDRAKTIDKY